MSQQIIIPKCDFCGKEEAIFGQAYKCRTYRSRVIPLAADMIDAWVACDECERFVENGDWLALAHYCARQIKTTKMSYIEKVALILNIHKEFREHRI